MELLAALLFLGAVLGHFALVVRSHNWFYGAPLHRYVTDLLQIIHGLAFLAGPVALFLLVGLDPTRLFAADAPPWHRLVAAYVVLCWLAGFVWLPWVTLSRRRHRCPVLESNHTATVDVAGKLGYKPSGDGKYRLLSLLPGNEVFKVDLVERTLLFPRLPAEWDGLTILQLTDLHFCGTPGREYFEQVMDLCRAREPDLLAVTGDVVDTLAHHDWIKPLLGRLSWKIDALAILGNHDHWYGPEGVREQLRALGMRVLANRWERIDVRGVPLVAIGNESPWLKPMPELTDCPDDVFRLCLSHTPDNIRWARRNRVDLMLSGHVHGGQVRLPGLGSLLVPSLYGRRFDCGVFHEPPTLLHVSRGLSGKHPIRYGCRPEVAWLVLRRGNQKSEVRKPGISDL